MLKRESAELQQQQQRQQAVIYAAPGAAPAPSGSVARPHVPAEGGGPQPILLLKRSQHP